VIIIEMWLPWTVTTMDRFYWIQMCV